MAIQTERFSQVLSLLGDALSSYGFQPQADEAGKTLTVAEDEAAAVYAGEKGALRLRYAGERVELYAADDLESLDADAKRVLVSLLPDGADERDVKYVVSEMADTLETRFSQKAAIKKKAVQKAPQTVSKAAVKAGTAVDRAELTALAERVLSGEVTRCPHGRPVALELTKRTLDRGFGRITG